MPAPHGWEVMKQRMTPQVLFPQYVVGLKDGRCDQTLTQGRQKSILGRRNQETKTDGRRHALGSDSSMFPEHRLLVGEQWLEIRPCWLIGSQICILFCISEKGTKAFQNSASG